VNLVTDRLVLADVCACADDEVVGEAGDFAEIQNYNVLRFFRLRGPYCN
jgi:hypothetical protein